MLSEIHEAELRESGLSPKTILRSGIRTVNGVTATQLLGERNQFGRGEFLLLPCVNTRGEIRYRVKPPPRDSAYAPGYEPVKTPPRYLQPIGVSSFACMTPGVAESELVVVTEGEKKCWSLYEAGFESIGLTGVWNWQVAKQFGPDGARLLIPDLADIDWTHRRVVILFDTDDYLKPGVIQPAHELATVLHKHGAIVSVHWLPTGDRDPGTGLPVKTAIDDYLFHFGSEAVQRQIEIATTVRPFVDLSEYRAALVRQRAAIIDPGIYIDTSPTGSGKSFADVEFAKMHPLSGWLFATPSHSQANEIQQQLIVAGIRAKKYPRLTRRNCKNFTEANAALRLGLAPTQSACQICEFRKGCTYQTALIAASKADVAIATHRRCELSFESMTKDRTYIAAQERAIELLSPIISASGPFTAIRDLASRLKTLASYFCNIKNQKLHDKIIQKVLFYDRMMEIADMLQTAIDSGDPVILDMPTDPPKLKGAQLEIFREIKEQKLKISGKSMQLVLAALAGLTKRVFVSFSHDGIPYCTGAISLELKEGKIMVMSDGTADAASGRQMMERISDHQVIDITPDASLRNKHLLIQSELDVKKATPVKRATDTLRTMLILAKSRLARLGVESPRIGVITHQEFGKQIKTAAVQLEPELKQMIKKIGHFWGTDSRGSNDWIAKCDALIVLGTPRPAKSAVSATLQRFCLYQALERSPRWSRDTSGSWHWSALTESGGRRHVKSVNYFDHDWHSAYNYLVASELTQCVGRARVNNDAGIPCFVASNHEIPGIGIRLTDTPIRPITDSATELLGLLERGYRKGEAAKKLGISTRHVSRMLSAIDQVLKPL